jgi:transcriptional regulator with XRE-family HTH domain
MRITPKKIAERFHAMLKEKKQEYGYGFNNFLHIETGLSSGYLSEIINGDKPGSQEAQMKICHALDVDYQAMITPEVKPDSRPPDDKKLLHLTEHQKMVSRFKDPPRGKYLNELLLEIEELDTDALNEVVGILQVKLNSLRGKKSSRKPHQDESSAS